MTCERRHGEETEKQRIDREVIELLNEMRVVLPGVQVLFAFLLILPFQQGWSQVTELERIVYLVAFLATTAATLFLMAPVTYHRLRFRARDKKRMLFYSNRLVLAGTAALAVAIGAAAFLIADVVVGDIGALAIAAVVALTLVGLWYGLPLREKAADGSGR